jgi:uncharacterized protein (TIGR02271 family)
VITQNDIAQLDGADVYATDGDKIGTIGQVYLDAETGDPEWVTVKTGLFGAKETFVPLRSADVSGNRITVAYDKERVKDAPRIDADGPITHEEEDKLYRFYGLSSSSSSTTTGATGSSSTSGATAGTGTATGTRSGGDDDAMTRSEERLVADTRTEQTGKARLRKYVTTEQEHVTVPVSHEEVRLEREPITDANAGDALRGPDISEAEHEVTLRAERPVVDTEAVPVERVRLGKETVREEQTVGGEVRKEQVEFDGPDGRDRR